jgi:GPH family glycoside/pentoside/hexuronide:cation symporter
MGFIKKPLSKGIKTFYGLGDMGFSLMTSVELFFFVFFLTNVAKFSLPMVALIGSITSIVDAILSPFYGAIISGVKPMRWGRNRSWMLIAPPLVIPLYMLQYTRISSSEVIAAVVVCLGFILSHIIWNIAWVANVSMIPAMANTPEERGMLSSRRATWTALAGVFFSYIGQPTALYIGEVTGNPALGYTLLAGIMATLMFLGYMVVFKLTKGYEPTGAEEAELASSSTKARVTFGGMLKNFYQNPPLIGLLLGDFFRFVGFFIITASAAFYFNYVAQNMALFPLYLLISSLAGVVGAAMSSKLIQKLSSRITTMVCLVIAGIALIIGNFVALSVPMFFVFATLARLFLGACGASFVAMYADVSIYGEWKTGENATPFVMGLMNLSLKTAIISRGTVIPLVLSLAGFNAALDPAQATEAVKQAVLTVNMLVPGVTAIISAIILLIGYKLTRERVAEMQIEIDSRKQQGANA